jgi:hypothetical protein
MHFSTLALTLLSTALPTTLAAALNAGSPETDPNLLFARQDVNGENSCSGPIVNLYAYSTTTCKNTDTSGTAARKNSPLRFGLKFAPFSLNLLVTNYESFCKEIPVLTPSDGPAQSLAFSADGARTDYCKLLVYGAENCQGDVAKSYNLNGRNLDGKGVGDCQIKTFYSAKVVCSRTTKNKFEV